jgi:predicted transcriptional regulator
MRRPKKKEYDYKKALRDNEQKQKSSKRKEDLSPKDEVKEMFYNWFRKRRKVGQVMSKQDVISNILIKLDKRQNKILDEAMDELKESGFIETQSDRVTLVLTQKGIEILN